MARKIVITSGKGGVGKTTVAANLGMRLSAMGERVVLADTDFGLNNIDVVCGVENRIVYDIVDAIEGRCRPNRRSCSTPTTPTCSSSPPTTPTRTSTYLRRRSA